MTKLLQCQSQRILPILLLGLAGLTVSHNIFGSEYPNTKSFGIEIDKSEQWYQQCLRVKDARPPNSDLPSDQLTNTLSSCNPTNLYYDAKSYSQTDASTEEQEESNWLNVRACAYEKKDASVLMMLYANGLGVQRNIDIAIRHACEAGGAYFEVSGRVNHLARMMKDQNSEDESEEIDFCDDATSGYMQGFCAAISARQNEKVRNNRLVDFVAKLAPNQKISFETLQKSLSDFVSAHSSNEINLNGTGSAAESIATESYEMDQFLNDLSQFETGDLPRFSKHQFSESDRELNQEYQKLMRAETRGFDRTGISQPGIRQTQKEWIKYRDALVTFGRIRYPSVDSPSWKALLTERRVKQLKELVEITIE